MTKRQVQLDPPAVEADLLEDMTKLAGSDGFANFPIHPSFSMVYAHEWHAKYNPDAIAVRYIKRDEPGGEKVDITRKEWVQRCRRAGKYVLDQMGLHEKDTLSPDKKLFTEGCGGKLTQPVVAMIAHADGFNYRQLDHGMQRAGLLPFLLSTNNSAAAIAHLCKATNTRAFLVGPPGNSALVDKTVEEALAILAKEGHPPVKIVPWPDPKVFTSGPDLDLSLPMLPLELSRPMVILHSSGTSAQYPKPIIQTERTMLCTIQWPNYSNAVSTGDIQYSGHLPPAHMMAFLGFCTCMGNGAIVGFAEPRNPPLPITPARALLAATLFDRSRPIFPPALVDFAFRDEVLVEQLKQAGRFWYGGGPLPRAAKENALRHGVAAYSIYGSTELGGATHHMYEGKDLPADVVELNPQIKFKFRPLEGEPGYFEMIACPKPPYYQPNVLNEVYQGEKVYATGDKVQLVEPSPPGSVRVRITGRVDAGIILSTGEKTNPDPIIDEVKKNSLVIDAVMFGQGKTHNGILIEMVPEARFDIRDERALADFRNKMWPFVEEANKIAPTHSAIYKEMILATSAEKPFERTAKGSIRTGVTLALYETEIEACYAAFDAASTSTLTAPTVWDDANTKQFVRSVVAEALRKPESQVQDAVDLFQSLGADSLVAAKIRNVITSALVSAAKSGNNEGKKALALKTTSVPSNLVYAHPTIEQLSSAVQALATGPSALDGAGVKNGTDSQLRRKKVLDDLIAKYSGAWPERSVNSTADLVNGHFQGGYAVLVTGTTGSAGAHFLAQLVAHPQVTRIYAINRSSRGTTLLQRQEEALKSRGEDVKCASDEKVVLLEADTSDTEHLGLEPEQYARIRDTVTHIIHNAWRLDFNLSVSSFESQIASVRAMALLALRSPRKHAPRLLFLSSIGTTSLWDQPDKFVPEEPLSPLLAGGGYGESKAVAEKILESVRNERGLEASTIRAGQLSGSRTNGAWATTDWLSLLIKSGEAIGCLPNLPGDSCWLPMDVLTRSVLDFAFHEGETDLSVPFALHLVNPKPSPWKKMIETAASLLYKGDGSTVKVVSANEWITAMEADVEKRGFEKAAASNPAVKLMDFFRSMVGAAVIRAEAAAASGGRGLVQREAFGAPRLSTVQAERISETLREASPTDEEDTRAWIGYWKSVGFLTA